MQYRNLGRTDLKVSTVCMGCWAIVGDFTWGQQDEGDALAAIHAALDSGINFFDTAEMYGSGYSEELLGRALRGRRDQVIIATKVSGASLNRRAMRKACEVSLYRLETDFIDLYQIHWPNRKIPMDRTLASLESLKSEGKIRAYGVSNFGKQDLTGLLSKGTVESNQLPYSLLWRPIEDEVQPLCVENSISILCYSPLCQGLLTGKFRSLDQVPEGRARTRLFSNDRLQARHSEPGCEAETLEALEKIRKICKSVGRPMGEVALAWLLAQPGVTSVVAGSRNAKQSRANAKAADLVLPSEVMAELTAAGEKVKEKIGNNIDPWEAQSRIR
ncbi:MAG: aldo/keto reductase [Armatimonadetes bacterium]|nr:aldo/keto reductase [Armatimonadota bacterium]